MYKIDLNSDLGEGAAFDAQIIPLITSANIACGFHAGSSEIMDETIALCKSAGVSAGAHPGYPDKENFGASLGRFILSSTLAQLIARTL